MESLRFRVVRLGVALAALAVALTGSAADAGLCDLRVNGMASPANVGPAPSFSWKTQGGASDRRQTAVRVTVRKAGESGDVWDSGEIATDLTTGIAYMGSALEVATKYAWTARTKDAAGAWTPAASGEFTTGFFNAADWRGSSWIYTGDRGDATGVSDFRATFAPAADKTVKEAFWTVTALGIFEAYVNGAPVTSAEADGSRVRDLLKPGYTETVKNHLVRHAWTYDVTAQLVAGANTLAARVGAGWWRDEILHKDQSIDATRRDCFRAVLTVRYTDGTSERFCTDTANWKAAYADGVTFATIYGGEHFDARVSRDWLAGGELDAKWKTPSVCVWNGAIEPFPGSNVRAREDLALAPTNAYAWADVTGAGDSVHGDVVVRRRYAAGEAMTLEPGETLIVDFGQNAGAIPEFVFSAAAGTELTALPAEILNEAGGAVSRGCDGPGGSAYRRNYRKAESKVRYVFAGGGDETYRPEFTYFGYRILSITATAPVTIKSLRSIPVTSIPKGFETGLFACANAKVNRLAANCRWGHYSNYVSVPTTCPSRDERNGWTGDAQMFAPAACWNANVRPFFAKYVADMRNGQCTSGKKDGQIDDAVPTGNCGCYTQTSAAWTDAAVMIPWLVYRRYGDVGVLRDNWPMVKAYLASVKGSATTETPNALYLPGSAYGDWLADGKTSKDGCDYDFVRDFYWLYDLRIAIEWAKLLGDSASEAAYAADFAEWRAYFRGAYLSGGKLADPSQRRCAMTLRLGILEPDEVAAVAEQFRAACADGKIHTGYVGTIFLLDTLSNEADLADVAYEMLLSEACPGWLHAVNYGATTVWENYDALTANGILKNEMNSYNNNPNGVVLDWLYSGIGGIRDDPAKPGYKHFFLRPQLDARLGGCDVSFESPYGTITSKWTCAADGAYSWTFTVPVNSTASVTAPNGAAAEYDPGTYTLTGKLGEGGAAEPETSGGDTPEGGGSPKKIILDVDCYSDFDDAGALACLHALADAGECEILATCVSTSDEQTKPALAQAPSVPTVEIINAYYGRSDIPVGATHRTLPVDVSSFTKTIGYLNSFVKSWTPAPAHFGSMAVEDAVTVYRRALANAPDGSVTICSTGFLSNLGQLLDSPADSISELTGRQLVAKKVKALYAMGCMIPNGREFNTCTDSAASKNVVDNWPTDIYFLTSNYGDNVHSGIPVSKLDTAKNPVAAIFAHELAAYGETATGHASWDEVALLAAVRGWERDFTVTRGTMTVAVSTTWSKDGKNSWTENATGSHYVLGEKTSYAEVGAILDELMTRAPGAKPETHDDAAWKYAKSRDWSDAIVCWGDSLTRGFGADSVAGTSAPTNYFPGLLTDGTVEKGYPFFLAERVQALGRPVFAVACDGAKSLAILAPTWYGTLRANEAFTLPASDRVQMKNLKNDMTGGAMLGPWLSATLSNVKSSASSTSGISGTFYDGDTPLARAHWYSSSYLQRLDESDVATEIPEGATFVTDVSGMFRKSINVIFSGCNDQYAGIDANIARIKGVVSGIEGGRYIVISSHVLSGATDDADGHGIRNAQEGAAKFDEEFGEHHLDLGKLMAEKGLATAVEIGVMTPEEAAQTTWGTRGTGLMNVYLDKYETPDGCHFNTKGYAVLAKFLYDKLVELGYVDGETPPVDPPETACDHEFGETPEETHPSTNHQPAFYVYRCAKCRAVERRFETKSYPLTDGVLRWLKADGTLADVDAGNGPTNDPYLVWFKPTAAADRHKALVVFPGGGYSYVNMKLEGCDVAQQLAEKGYTVAVCWYRGYVPENDNPMKDARAAMLAVRAYARSHALTQVGVCGFSAGGHLASYQHVHGQAADGTRPDFAVLGYPCITCGQSNSYPKLASHLGATTAEQKLAFCNNLHVTAGTTRTFIMVGVEDPTVPVENSYLFADALKTCGVAYRLKLYTDPDYYWTTHHGCCFKPDGLLDEIVAWIENSAAPTLDDRVTEPEVEPGEDDWGVSNVVQTAEGPAYVLTFTNTLATGWSWTVPANVAKVEALVVGGGAGGGAGKANAYGGGGGGGFAASKTLSVAAGETLTVFVGRGGAGIALTNGGKSFTAGENGGESKIVNAAGTPLASAPGGGYGAAAGSSCQAPAAGGPGGGGGGGSSSVSAGVAGNPGGAGASGVKGAAGGAGGGATGDASGATPGAGLESEISGARVEYGRGGAGATVEVPVAVAGADGTGEGGAGGGNAGNGAAGGSGVVVIRYMFAGGEPEPPVDPEDDPQGPAGADWGWAKTNAATRVVTVAFTNAAESGWNWTLPDDVAEIEYLVVGGGAGGGAGKANAYGGGGGGGCAATGTRVGLGGVTLHATVGAGGAGGELLDGGKFGESANGGVSTLQIAGGETIVTALGGGCGGNAGSSGNAGGSSGTGGGGAGGSSRVGAAGTGSVGGKGADGVKAAAGGAGGGATGDAVSATPGAGLESEISGTRVEYGRGGAGATVEVPVAVAGADGTGAGGSGGGSLRNGAPGGSGIVILRYALGGAPESPKDPVVPGEATGTTYADRAAAEAARPDAATPPKEVEKALEADPESLAQYVGCFEVMTRQNDEGRWVNEAVLTEKAETALQEQVDEGAVNVLPSLAASEEGLTISPVTPGFYYALEFGETPQALKRQVAVLATDADGLTLNLVRGQSCGFYRVVASEAAR